MNPVHRLRPYRRKSPLAALAVTVAVSLAACGGGVSPGSRGIDPGVTDYKVAYVKRPLPTNNQGDPRQADLRDPLAVGAGGDLYVKDRAAPSAAATNITGGITGSQGDVKDVEVSYDGTKLLFALIVTDSDPNDDIEPTWNIWEYDLNSSQLRRVISSDANSEKGHDIAPHYLPDGRIIFSSTRQRQAGAVLLDEGKPLFSSLVENGNQAATVLHVMDADGSNIHQVSFNQSHDLDPLVLENGQVLFSRWDNAGGNNAINLYRMNPDGTGLQMIYGVHSHDSGSNGSTVQFVQTRQMPDNRILGLVQPFTRDYIVGGDVMFIDIANYIDNTQPTWNNLGVLSGPALAPATINTVYTDDSISPGGRYSAAFPLWDGTNRIIVSWSQCQLLLNNLNVPCTSQNLANPNAVEAPPRYGIWMYDLTNHTQQPVVNAQDGYIFTDVVVAQPRTAPAIIPDDVFDPSWITEGVGAIHIRSVYDFGDNSFNGCFLTDCTSASNINSLSDLADPAKAVADERPARFLRIVKAVGIPDPNDPTLADPPNLAGAAFGPSRQQGMREIIGYVPVEPDGSVKAKVPANVPLAISVVDKQGRRIGPRHENWLQVVPGETLECNGCHTHTTSNNAPPLPHGRSDAIAPSINAGAPSDGYVFPNTVSTIYADYGDTMAEARTRLDPDALLPRVDIVYNDDWTDAAARTPDTAFSYPYIGVGGLTTPAPITAACQPDWTNICRIIINYEQHIHPLWSVDRGADTCINCHSDTDANSNACVPDAQLDLTDGISDQNSAQYKAYRELLFRDNEQELVGGVLQDRMVPGPPDPETGDPTQVPVPVYPSMSANGARASSRFFSVFDSGNSHAGRLSAAELRLLHEWLDIGAQYFNNPFDPAVPTN